MEYNPTKLIGILNLTHDSFSDGGKYNTPRKAIARAKKLAKEGIDILDIGAESSGPGSLSVALHEELHRIIPVIQKLKKDQYTVPISVDTYKAEVAKQALELGVEMINDVTALRGDPDMAKVLAEYKPYVVLMYSKDPDARTTLESRTYKDVIHDIKYFLLERAQIAIRWGIPKEKIILDPGMGAFVSTLPKYSFEILNRLSEIQELGYPVLIGHSRKSFLGGELNTRQNKTLAVTGFCAEKGVDYIRVHDVRESREVVDTVGKIIINK